MHKKNHVEVGSTENLISMVFDTDNTKLIGAIYNTLYSIDLCSGTGSELNNISNITSGLDKGFAIENVLKIHLRTIQSCYFAQNQGAFTQ
jgi:hypothetical protein